MLVSQGSKVLPGHPDSYYAATPRGAPDLPRLEADTRADVCIVGGGFCGLMAALEMAEKGLDVVLLEAERVGWGASGRNGGQVGSGQRQDQMTLESALGKETARRLWELAEEAKALVRERVKRHAIDCDLTDGVLNAAVKPGDAEWIARYVDHMAEHYDYPHFQWIDRAGMAERLGTDIYHGGKQDMTALHLHPLNYALGLARAAQQAGARLFEHARVSGYDPSNPTRVRTAAGPTVTADQVVICCNGYLGRLEPRVAGRIMPINNYVIATEPLGEARARELIRDNVAVADTKFVIDYYRLSADHRLLFGGGETYSHRFPADIAGFVKPHMLKVYPQLADARIEYAWGGTLAITLKRLPHVGRLSPNVLFAHGFSGHGVGIASLLGRLLAEAAVGQASRFDVMARLPTPMFPGGTLLRHPALVVGMLYYALRDRL
ncbi:NAD(P)/FAD-dependent oxidoreductase [Roseospirillum parvum]|uniref:Gamma-glutamylputrescine oxidase n=1 Tax=Roseospirillum parvum TaxID=83401 RepID=A0A1G7U9T0_9PROT|nr:FAD-binding oxidoreductase [Roseospirillum parvum]SDG43520.1 gamma-glutamylputrescine oxidase [Roseospirillum parvum]